MSSRQSQIVAIGGGGFLMEPDDLTLDRYVLEQAGVQQPAVLFIPTASGDADHAIVRFYKAFQTLPSRPAHLELFDRTPDLRQLILAQDVIYVGGGNTKSMLAVWEAWHIPELLREAWESGVVLAGVSAGAICWFEHGVTDSHSGSLQALECLGFLPGSCCPHYDGDAERRPAYHRLVAEGSIGSGFAIDDGAAIHFLAREPHRIVRSRERATAHQVRLIEGTVEETLLALERPCPSP